METLIVGAGFSGLTTALELQKLGIEDFLIVEKSERVGGTWENNRYPGAECDVPSLCYIPLEKSSKFIPSTRFSGASEIQRFTEVIVDEHGLRNRIKLLTALKASEWREADCTWLVTLHDENANKMWQIICRYLVFGIGPLSLPRLPDISHPFQGLRVHSADFPKDLNLEGKTVAVVGTGASAIQVIPVIGKKVKKLYVFQRTPSYVDDKPTEDFVPPPQLFGSAEQRNAFVNRKRREFDYWADELYLQFLSKPKVNAMEKEEWKKRLAAKVSDPILREKLTPSYPMGCKRLGYVNGYYETLQMPHVELIAEEVKAETPDGLVTSKGTRVQGLDVIIYCTGFDAPYYFFEEMVNIKGKNGALLKPSKTGYDSLYGIYIGNNFPNAFSLCGPQGFLVHVSSTSLIDLQAEYIAKAIALARANGFKRIVPKNEACKQWTATCKETGQKSMWTACASWYNRGGNDFVGFAGKISLYASFLTQDGFSKAEFSTNVNQPPKTFTSAEAPFDLLPEKQPPWPILQSMPHEDF